MIAGGFNKLAKFMAVTVDLGWVDGVSKFLSRIVESAAEKWRWIESGFVRNYALFIFLGVVVILGYIIFG